MVNANALEHPDLFKTLKGEGNNFGTASIRLLFVSAVD